MIDTVSAARRLASRGSGFKASNEAIASIAGGITAKLADALMAALCPHFESLSGEDATAILELYEATLSVAMTAEAVNVPEVHSFAEQRDPVHHHLMRWVEMKPLGHLLPVP